MNIKKGNFIKNTQLKAVLQYVVSMYLFISTSHVLSHLEHVK